MLERLNQEIKRRTHIVRSFTNEASCLRLARAFVAEIHEYWVEAKRYLNMALYHEHLKQRRIEEGVALRIQAVSLSLYGAPAGRRCERNGNPTAAPPSRIPTLPGARVVLQRCPILPQDAKTLTHP